MQGQHVVRVMGSTGFCAHRDWCNTYATEIYYSVNASSKVGKIDNVFIWSSINKLITASYEVVLYCFPSLRELAYRVAVGYKCNNGHHIAYRFKHPVDDKVSWKMHWMERVCACLLNIIGIIHKITRWYRYLSSPVVTALSPAEAFCEMLPNEALHTRRI